MPSSLNRRCSPRTGWHRSLTSYDAAAALGQPHRRLAAHPAIAALSDSSTTGLGDGSPCSTRSTLTC